MQREKAFDSLKFILICLVVIGHVIERNLFSDHPTTVLFAFIYTFHMPLFIFISGYFTRNITWSKYKKSAISILGTYVVFQALFSISYILKGDFSWKETLISPHGVLWYILGLLFWRFWFAVLPLRVRKFPLMLGISLVLAYGIHYINGHNYFFTRFFSFFPYFILGYFCSGDIITKIRSFKKVYSVLFLGTLYAGLYFLVSKNFVFTLFGGMPYGYYTSLPEGLMLITVCYVLTIITSVCVINVSSERFYKLGSSTLDIYLLHPFYVYVIYVTCILEYNNWNPSVVVDVLVAFVIIAICWYISTFRITKYFTDPVNAFKGRLMQKTVE